MQAVTGYSYALLADGTTAEIRPAGPDDLDAVTRFHQDMSPDNLYLRFFSLSKRAGEQEARRVCRPTDADHAALLALLGPQVVGLASYELTGTPGLAEIAFAVADDMHGRGIATLLLEHLVSLGRARRVQAFTATTLPANAPMLRVFADVGLRCPQAPGRRRDRGDHADPRRRGAGRGQRLPGRGGGPGAAGGRGQPRPAAGPAVGGGGRRQPARRIHRTDDPAQHPRRGFRGRAVRGEPARGGDRRCAVPAVGRPTCPPCPTWRWSPCRRPRCRRWPGNAGNGECGAWW